MSRFETIEPDFWSRSPFCDLTPTAKLVYVWSRTNPACVMSGIYRSRAEQIVLDTGLEPDDVARALRELDDQAVVRSEDGGMLWVCDRVQQLRGRNPSVAKGIARDVGELEPAHSFRIAFLSRYAAVPWLRDALHPLEAENVPEQGSTEGHLTLTKSRSPKPNSVSLTRPSPEGPMQLPLPDAFGSEEASRRDTREDAIGHHHPATFHAEIIAADTERK